MEPQNTVKERLKSFIAYLNISEREFCRIVGVSVAYIASIKKSISADKLQTITKHFPELNPVWLIRGDGEMLLPGVTPQLPLPAPAPSSGSGALPSEMLAELLADAKEEKARLLGIIESQQRTIESLAAATSKKADALSGGGATCADAG